MKVLIAGGAGYIGSTIASACPDAGISPVILDSLEFTAHLLRNGCPRLIFSSSAAIYRASEDLSVDEESAIDPQSPYARTKAVCETMLADIAAARPIRVLSLRYFNPIGADPGMRTGLQLRRPRRTWPRSPGSTPCPGR
jgi:UDP-glucose 4-epimerase